MNENQLIHGHLDSSNILVDEFSNVKLFNFGFNYMTNSGTYVSFPLNVNVKYSPPERLLGSQNNIKGDVWSAALIVAEVLLDVTFWHSLKVGQMIRKVLTLLSVDNVLEKIAREHDRFKEYSEMEPKLRNFLENCLSVRPSKRPLPKEILQQDLFSGDVNLKYHIPKKELSLLHRVSLDQIYYWWQLAGGDVMADLKKEGVIKNEAPILSIPSLVLLDGRETLQPKSQNFLFDNKVIFLSLNNVLEKLARIQKAAFFPLIHTSKFVTAYDTQLKRLPLLIRERDTEYQFYRIMEFTRLLQGYPFTRDAIIESAAADIPPPLRGKIWAAILGVVRTGFYEQIDKISVTCTDRQIEVDIPRCHQYDELLSSPTGHHKLKRLLKAWVASHPQYVYWQGLDSLAAVFLHLNFNDEETAFQSLCKFIPKYLHWFFLKDNSAIIKECLAKFSQLTAFHEPTLARHMININFIPELFAIPWFLTCFSHAFPLHKIVHLWDGLIANGNHNYPLFIGIAILRQLKTTLLESGFNECILLFSDLPDIVIENCVTQSQSLYESTPVSVCWRKYVEGKDEQPNLLDISNVDLAEMQSELLPRISANDLLELLRERLEHVIILDIRSSTDFQRQHIPNSINIPFNSIELDVKKLSALGVANLEALLSDKIVVVVSVVHENALMFSNHLMDLGVSQVCVLHKGFNIFHNISPSILVTS